MNKTSDTKKGIIKKIIIAAVVFIVLLGIAFVTWKFVIPQDGPFVKSATGMQVTPAIGAEKTDKLINESGGEVDLQSGSTTSKLILPQKSVSSPTSIEIKKIDSISGLSTDTDFITGVQLGPDGTWLDVSADLKISLTDDQLSKKLVGFSYSADGKDFHFYPIQVSNKEATFTLSGFSSYGILELKDDKAEPVVPSTIEHQAQQLIANIVKEGQTQNGSVNANQANRIKNILSAWYKVSLRGALKDAENNPDKIDSALHEYKSWLTVVQIFGLDDNFKAEIDSSLNSLALAIKNASEKASKACTDEKDPVKASKLLRYFKITELMGLDGRAGLKSHDIQEMVKRCVRFKITVKSKFITGTTDKSSDEAEGEGVITLNDAMQLSGSGTITVTDYHLNVNESACTVNTPEVWPFTIPPFSLTESSSNKLSLPFDLGAPPNVTWECGQKIRQLTGDPNSGVTESGDEWSFVLTHQDEMLHQSAAGASYLLKDWEVVGSGGIFAHKVYNRSKTLSVIGLSLPIEEQTTFELVHDPEN